MISVIISSIDKDLLKQVKSNIIETIGLECEIIAIDNLNTGRGICEVYNEATILAKFPILCFMHEDIVLETQNWGQKVIEIFSAQNVGLLGIAGSTMRSAVPSGWFPPAEFGTKSWRLNINQGSRYQNREKKHEYFNPKNELTSKVTCVDGVWFCTTKKLAQSIKFDDQLLQGFHGYDIDFSLSIAQTHDVLVTYDILLTHASDGNFDNTWLKEIIKVQKKWMAKLPVFSDDYSSDESKILEDRSLKRFFKELIKNKDFNKKERSELLSFYYKNRRLKFFKYLKFWYKNLVG
ncbi:glycosyltransferase [Pedobacter paludis]|uniref:Streptomycin biosynthesis protein StrF domain-containing protein n=1 Tax=Pedobacter paludis TaxID=2203212 RepID=A0A317EX08_9SPHI|nr:glycosyltransferase [Pedobacter paludis]PWS31095.1 hypothetical protein DF947_16015 [Pedobacter paludis]